MSKTPAIIDSNGIKIFSTNKQNIIEANNDKIIEVDNESREVIKKGYLLNNINLSTIPTIIQDAINAAVIDAKNATLRDELIETLKQSLLNLDDGVYKKTYIDTMMTYVENLLTSKVNLETVASIADSKIALATENLAATSQVELLTSRVGNSESEITNVKNTINTKDLARATQIEELEANINDTFAGYSEAIDLVVGSDGSIKSQKIESLTTNIGLQLQEINQLIVDTDGEWKANSMKLITNPSGAITGYSFQDGSGLRSNFTINADSFKIANSTNTYVPFSIVDNNIVFNGKVSFSNTTTSSGDNLIDVLDTFEQNRINAINAVSIAYKNYTAVVTKAMADGVLTAEEQTLIADASSAVNLAKARFSNIEETIIDISEKISSINTNNTLLLLEAANLDNKISKQEQDFINNLLSEEKSRISDILDRVKAEAQLDGKITTEEQNRINAINNLDTAYKNYISIVTKAMADGVLTAEEQTLIVDATDAVNLAKARFLELEDMISNISKVEDIDWQSEVQAAIDNNATTFDGAKIITGTIGANQINANAISGKIISGGIITGTSIYGSYIEGAIIKASFIDLTSTQTLTNWQQYTPANYPSTYANNFAHNNDGTLLVDSLGYVRLMGNTNIVTQQLVYENNYSGSTMPLTLPTYSIDFYPYSDYKSNTLNRCITSTPTLSIPTSQKIVFCSLTTSTGNNTGTTNTIVRCYINNDYYEISATGTVASDSLSYSFSCNIKKNSVVIGSSASISGVTHTAYIGNLPIQISVKATWGYGLYPSINIGTVNTLSSSTSINYTGIYGKAFQLSYAYSSNRMYSNINVPAITVNG